MGLKDEFLKVCIGEYERAAAMMEESGQVLSRGNVYTTYSQYIGYYFAFLLTYESAGNPYRGTAGALKKAIRAWDLYFTQT